MFVTILATVIVLGVLILVHELGHFWAAKAVDIGVPRFSIGLGPKLWGFRRGETEYVVSWLPLGGYVRMQGMGEEAVMARIEGGVEEESSEPSDRDFEAKPLWARTLVISAGVLANLLFAFLAFAALARAAPDVEARIGEVADGSPAAQAGLEPRDVILRIDGDRVYGWRDVLMGVRERPGQKLELTVRRDGELLRLQATPDRISEYSEIARDTVYFGQLGILRAEDAARTVPSFGQAIVRGGQQTVFWVVSVVEFIWQLITGESSARELGGPILIGQISGEAARAGIWTLLNFMAVISVNLAILNLLPIPVLDGGWLVFLAIEGVRGRALSLEQRLRLTQVGMLVVVGIMIWAIGNDLLRLFGA